MTNAAGFGFLSLGVVVPPEIVAKIFLHTIDDSESLKLPPRLSQCPWTLRSVCSSWRQVALHEYRLWNNVTVSGPVPGWVFGNLAKYDYVGEILPPRGPLSITFSSPNRVTDDILDTIVIPYLTRITKLHIDAFLPSVSKFWSLPPESLSSIRDISFTTPDYHDPSPVLLQPEQNHILQFIPNLRKLKLNGLTGGAVQPIDIQIPRITWSQLTHIDLCWPKTVMRDHTIFSILSQCHSLESFTATFTERRHEPMPVLVPGKNDLSLPYLTSIKLYGGFLNNYLDLGLPWTQLRNVSLEGRDGDEGLILAKLTTTIHIEELGILNANGVGHANHRSPEIRFSHLRTLCLDNSGVPLLPVLVAPKLEKLVLSSVYDLGSDFPHPAQQIMNFLHRSRCSLKVFEYHIPGSSLDDDRNNISSILVSLDSLYEFSASFINLGENVLKKIGEGVLLPKLRRFDTFVESPGLFVDVVEDRVKMGSSLREGYACVAHGGTNYDPNSMTDAEERLERLNGTFGTNFYFPDSC